MNPENRFDIDSGILRAVPDRRKTSATRVRLLVAIPAVIVLFLCIMAAVFFQITETFMTSQRSGSPQSLQDFSRDWLLFLGFFVTGGAVVGYLLAWSLTKPIKDYIRFSERVAGGDLRSKVPVTRQDEMGQLGSSFNHMIDSLNHFIDTRNRFILESFSGGLVVTDLNGTITAINSAAENLLNLTSENATGKPIREVFNNPELSDFLRYHERVLWKQETLLDKRINLKVNGMPQTVTVNFTSMRDSNGNVFGVIINLRDLQEMERFYEHMRNSDRLATMGTFASGLAHEIKNPLGAIKGTAQLLAEDLGAHPSAERYIQVILKEVNRLDSLVREVQAYGQPASDKTPTNINTQIEEIVHLFRADEKLKGKAYSLETRLQDLPTTVLSRSQFRMAILNLLLNAYDALTPGEMILVETRFNRLHNYPIQVRISNHGEPIPAETQARIFEPFFTTKASGTGLGLSITKQITGNHGGRIVLEQSGDIITFIMELPSDSVTPVPA